ncbi:MAG: DUF2281 domain-containing protein [Bacteroidetes bacterium]|nr:DUF2281 domain-containing protein [Bacteroidota bacterium]
MTSLTLYTKIETLPADLKAKAKSFIEHLMEKSVENKNNDQNQRVEKRSFGSLKGKIILSDDFDEPLEDFKEYM